MGGFAFEAELYLWQQRADSWTFVDVPPDVSEEIRAALTEPPRGFGSVPVRVRVGSTSWETSIFPSGEGAFSLPVKRAVRVAESLDVGDVVPVTLELR